MILHTHEEDMDTEMIVYPHEEDVRYLLEVQVQDRVTNSIAHPHTLHASDVMMWIIKQFEDRKAEQSEAKHNRDDTTSVFFQMILKCTVVMFVWW